MHEPRFKPLLVWEPFPYILLFVLVVVAGSIRPNAAPIAFWIAAAVAAVSAGYFVWAYIDYGRRAKQNPDAGGNLSSLDGLELVFAPHSNQEISPTVTVGDAYRHQAAIEIARIHGGDQVTAVLVPRASRWLSLRYRVGVQLVARDTIRHAGFLPELADKRWRDELGALRTAGAYVQVPARIRGAERPFTVDIDISGLPDTLANRARG